VRGYNRKLAFECSTYADRALRFYHGAEMQQRDAGLTRYKRLTRQLRALHDKIHTALQRNDPTQFLEARAEQLFVQQEQVANVVNELEAFLRERWDSFFTECYTRLRVVHGGG
jgi:hypothetical protein